MTATITSFTTQTSLVDSLPLTLRSFYKPTVLSLIRRYSSWVVYDSSQPDYCRSAFRRIFSCRSGDFGSHNYQCGNCNASKTVYSSCNNRHCPCCSWLRKRLWLNKVLSWRIPCSYYHNVFTTPHEFNQLFAINAAIMYPLLFRCVQKVLLEAAKKEYGCQPGLILALHTWGQRMHLHVHIHAIMTAGGLSIPAKVKETGSIEPASSESSITDGSISKTSAPQSPPQTWIAIPSDSPAMYYKLLAFAFRKKFLRAIKRVYKEGKLRIPNSESMTGVRNFETFEAWLAPVAAKEWVVDAKATPNDPKDQNAVLGYIANYIAGTAVFDGRIKKDDGSHVTIRFKDYRNDCKSTETMLGTEFVRRFLLHIVPGGVNRVRYAGIFYSGKRMQRLDLCRQLIQSASGPFRESKPSSLMTPQLLSGASGYESKCSSCGALDMRSKGFRNRWSTHQSISTLQHLIAIYTICYTTLDSVVEQI